MDGYNGKLAAVEVIAGNDGWATRLIHVNGAVRRIITAFDASARTGRFNELNIVLVPEAGTSLWVTPASSTTTGIILATRIVRIQARKHGRPNTPGELCITLPVFAFTTFKSHVEPKVRRKLTLVWRIPTVRGTISLHASGVLRVTNVSVWITRHDHAKLVCTSHVDDIVHGSCEDRAGYNG